MFLTSWRGSYVSFIQSLKCCTFALFHSSLSLSSSTWASYCSSVSDDVFYAIYLGQFLVVLTSHYVTNSTNVSTPAHDGNRIKVHGILKIRIHHYSEEKWGLFRCNSIYPHIQAFIIINKYFICQVSDFFSRNNFFNLKVKK